MATRDDLRREDLFLAEQLVSRGVAPRERVEECLSDLLARLESGGEAARLEQVLTSKGVVSPEQIQTTLRAADADATLKRSPSGVELRPSPGQGYRSDAAFDSRYAIGGEIARGGMGIILDGKDLQIRRELAVKVLLEEQADAEQVARFVEEAQVQGQLEHPNICPVHELGKDARGRLYFTMKKVKGLSLAQVLHGLRRGDDEALRHGYTLTRLLEVFAKICDAVAFAHSRGVVHRDLKPENVMIGEFGEVLVMDWGLAKILGREDRHRGRLVVSSRVEQGDLLSLDGRIMGTPAYMPPEQAAGRLDEVDERSDVYALGGILYAILTLRAPLEGTDVHDLLQKARDGAVVPPSRRAPDRPVPPDLEAAAMKALASDRLKRYSSVAEFRADITAFLEGRTLAAAQYSLPQVAAKWVRRNRVFTLTASAAAALLLAGAVFYLVRVTRAETQARAEAARAGTAEADARRQMKEAQERRREAELNLAYALAAQGDAYLRAGRPGDARIRYEAARKSLLELGVVPVRADSGLAQLYRDHPPALLSRRAAQGERWAVDVTPDGRTLAVGNRHPPFLELFDLPSGRRARALDGLGGSVAAAAFSPDGLRLVAGDDEHVTLMDLAGGAPPRRLARHVYGVWSVAFSPDGRAVLSHGGDGVVRLWDVETAAELRTFPSHNGNISEAVFSPDGRRVLAPAPGNEARLWDAADGSLVRSFKGHASLVIAVALSPDGARAATGGHDKTVRLWDVASGRELGVLRGHTGFVRRVRFSADGRRLLSFGWDRTLRLWDVEGFRELRAFSEHSNRVYDARFLPDGRRAVSVSDDGFLKVWELRDDPAPLPGGTTAAAFSPDGRLLALLAGGAPRLFDAETRRELERLGLSGASALVFTPDGRELRTAGGDRRVRRWDLASGRELEALEGLPQAATCLAVCEKGCHAAAGASDGTIRVWPPGMPLQGHQGRVAGLHFADEERLVSAGHDQTLRIWDLATGAHRSLPLGTAATSLAGGGGKAVVGTWGAGVLTLDLRAEGAALEALHGHTAGLSSVAASADGGLALSGSWDATARLWNLEAQEEIRAFDSHAGSLAAVALSPDGRGALVAAPEVTRLWDFSLASRLAEQAARAAQALARLDERPGDAEALATLGEWHAFRGQEDWASILLEAARAAGARVSALQLARAYAAQGRGGDARRELEAALAAGEAPEAYVRLWLRASPGK